MHPHGCAGQCLPGPRAPLRLPPWTPPTQQAVSAGLRCPRPAAL